MQIYRNISTSQLTWILGTLVGLGMAIFMGSAVGNADFAIVSIVFGAGIGAATFIILGRNYWVLIPFSLGASFPAVPLGGRTLEFPEAAITACSLFYLVRLASRKEKLHIVRFANVPILLFVAWVALVFTLNPVGLAMLGSEVAGSRFYFKLALAFAAFVIMSSRQYTERDVKLMLGLLVFGAFFSLAYGFAEYTVIGPAAAISTGPDGDNFYSWHQLLALPPVTIGFLIFARWSPKEVFSLRNAWLILSYVVCVLLVLISGKRMAIVAMFLAPVVSAILHRQFAHLILAVLLAALVLSIAVFGHRQLFQLPLVAQRTISFLPGNWDAELDGFAGGADEWRSALRTWAWEVIKQKPWLGSGFGVSIQETTVAASMSARGGPMDTQVAMYALGRSWHNRWLGYAADFGIPLSIIQGLMYLWVLALSLQVFRRYGNASLFGVFALYLFIFTTRDIISSNTSGHTAIDAWQRWWMYGVIVSLWLHTSYSHNRLAPAAKESLALTNAPPRRQNHAHGTSA